MKTPTYQDYLADFSTREQIEHAARRARIQTIRQYVVQPLIRFCGSLLRLPTVSGARILPR